MVLLKCLTGPESLCGKEDFLKDKPNLPLPTLYIMVQKLDVTVWCVSKLCKWQRGARLITIPDATKRNLQSQVSVRVRFKQTHSE